VTVSLDSDTTNGPFFWYRVVSKFAPKGRNCHSASMVGDKMMVFGGFGGSKWFDELWVFDTHFIDWYRPEVRSAAQGSPPPRYAHSGSIEALLRLY
jgi:hypothetical protein